MKIDNNILYLIGGILLGMIIPWKIVIVIALIVAIIYVSKHKFK
jgi:4-amino-4-deoxy-L-arabinose transferase-like glycosyltransferase